MGLIPIFKFEITSVRFIEYPVGPWLDRKGKLYLTEPFSLFGVALWYVPVA